MNQHFIDDDLKIDRHRDAEQIKNNRGDHNIAQQAALPPHLIDEPSNIEGSIGIIGGELALDQNDIAIPDATELHRLQELKFGPAGRIDDYDQVVFLKPALVSR